MFVCTKIDGVSRLTADLTIECAGAAHSAYTAYDAFIIAVFPIGTPLVVVYVLRQYRERIKQNETKRDADVVLQGSGLSYLYDSYKPVYWWFEFFETVRRLCPTFIPLLMAYSGLGPLVNLMTTFLILLACFCVYINVLPFTNGLDNFVGCFGALAPVASLLRY